MKTCINKFLVIGIEVSDDEYFKIVEKVEELDSVEYSEFTTSKVYEETIERSFKLNIGWEILFNAFGNSFYSIKEEEASTNGRNMFCINGKYVDESIYELVYRYFLENDVPAKMEQEILPDKKRKSSLTADDKDIIAALAK